MPSSKAVTVVVLLIVGCVVGAEEPEVPALHTAVGTSASISVVLLSQHVIKCLTILITTLNNVLKRGTGLSCKLMYTTGLHRRGRH